jgi:hypothetical protein
MSTKGKSLDEIRADYGIGGQSKHGVPSNIMGHARPVVLTRQRAGITPRRRLLSSTGANGDERSGIWPPLPATR